MGLVDNKSMLRCQETINKWSSGTSMLKVFNKETILKYFKVKIGYTITKQNLQIVYDITFMSPEMLRK